MYRHIISMNDNIKTSVEQDLDLNQIYAPLQRFQPLPALSTSTVLVQDSFVQFLATYALS